MLQNLRFLIFKEHGRLGCSVSSVSKDVAEVYGSYAPYQFLSYWLVLWWYFAYQLFIFSNNSSFLISSMSSLWSLSLWFRFELWGSYERKFGKLSSMDASDYGLITGHNMRNKGIAWSYKRNILLYRNHILFWKANTTKASSSMNGYRVKS